jgi:hypothetical protein
MDDTNTTDRDILKQEYNILVELIKHQHTRVQDFDKTFLTANTILIGACAILLGGTNSKLFSYLIPLCILGIAISLIWLCVLQRMKVDSDLRWFQLRNVERLLSREKGIFSGGHAFFKNKNLQSSDGKELPLVFPDGIQGLLAKFRVVWAGAILPLLFSGLYAVLIFIGKRC